MLSRLDVAMDDIGRQLMHGTGDFDDRHGFARVLAELRRNATFRGRYGIT